MLFWLILNFGGPPTASEGSSKGGHKHQDIPKSMVFRLSDPPKLPDRAIRPYSRKFLAPRSYSSSFPKHPPPPSGPGFWKYPILDPFFFLAPFGRHSFPYLVFSAVFWTSPCSFAHQTTNSSSNFLLARFARSLFFAIGITLPVPDRRIDEAP